MSRISDINIKKFPSGWDKKFAGEAVIKFESIADKDMIKGSAFRLAGKKGHSISLELPSHLLSQHRMVDNT